MGSIWWDRDGAGAKKKAGLHLPWCGPASIRGLALPAHPYGQLTLRVGEPDIQLSTVPLERLQRHLSDLLNPCIPRLSWVVLDPGRALFKSWSLVERAFHAGRAV